MRPEFLLFLFMRIRGAADEEFSELRASRLAHRQLGPATK